MKSIWNKETVHWINLADAHIFQQQYNLYFRQLKYFGMHYIADEEVVCDLIQDLWLKIWERKENRINEATFKQYLFQGLYRSILDYIKHNNVLKYPSEPPQARPPLSTLLFTLCS